MKHFIYITILLLFTLTSCSRGSSEVAEDNSSNNLYFKEGIRSLSPFIEAPDFVLSNLEGKQVSLDDFKGRVVLINFWAKWCSPCVQEMPSIDRLNTAVKEDGIVVLTINIGESKSAISEFINDNNYKFETLLDKSKTVSSKFGVRSIPSTFIINKKGEITGTKIGAHEWDSEGVIEILKELDAQ